MIIDINKIYATFKNRLIILLWKLKNPMIWLVLGLGLLVLSTFYFFIYRYLKNEAIEISRNLLPGYSPTKDAGYFKSELIGYVLFQLYFIAILIIYWGRSFWYQRALILSRYYRYIFLGLLVIPGILLLATVEPVLRIYLSASFIFFFIGLNLSPKIDKFKFFKSPRIYKYKFQITPKIYALTTLVIALVLIYPGMRAWSNLALPNDFYEISDSFNLNVSGAQVIVNRKEVSDCIAIKFHSIECKRLNNLQIPFLNSSDWQIETGRILFHHSYIFVPAIHYLKYGLTTSVPYLYGHGNTLFHAYLMKAYGSNLSAYFESFPWAILAGLLLITVLIGYCSKSYVITLLAFILCLDQLYSVGFGAAILAASFSPMRYLGVLLQITSIFYILRGKPIRVMGVYFASFFSLFWNFEFGVIGLIGQLLIFFSSKLNCSLFTRIISIFIISGLAFFFYTISNLTLDIVRNISLGFFQINMPAIFPHKIFFSLLSIFSFEVILVLLCLGFQGKERLARLVLLPILAFLFIKPIFNPSGPHLAISMAFILPCLLLYLPISAGGKYHNFNLFDKSIPSTLIGIVVVVSIFICVNSGNKYAGDSKWMHTYLIDPFIVKPWIGLDETLPMVTPGEEISQRVGLIKKYLKNDDSLLILSPFDQTLSFYLNPNQYCGHFDLISNVATQQNIDQVVTCFNSKKDITVVYDLLMNKGCPIRPLDSIIDCKKMDAKQNVLQILDRIKPNLVEVGRSADLIIFKKIVRDKF